MQKEYQIGDVISYVPFGGGRRTGVVTNKEDDVKNGRPGFDMRGLDGESYWGYDDQIIEVTAAETGCHI